MWALNLEDILAMTDDILQANKNTDKTYKDLL